MAATSTQQSKKVYRQRLLIGGHRQKGADGKPVDYHASQGYPVIESTIDLCAAFNSKDPNKPRKFEPVLDDMPLGPSSPFSADGSDPNNVDDTLEAMTVEELKQFAASEEINLRGATKKEDLIKVIRGSLA